MYIADQDIITTNQRHELPNGAIINRFTHIVKGAYIGKDVMIGERCYIAAGAIIGDGSRIQNGNDIWDGIEIGMNVFIGPKCNLTNHHAPEIRPKGKFVPDIIKIGKGAVIGTNVTIIAPCIIEADVRVGAGTIITKDLLDDRGWYVGDVKLKHLMSEMEKEA